MFERTKTYIVRLLALALLCSSATLAAKDAELAGLIEAKLFKQANALLDNGCDLNATQPDGMTALHWAVHQGNADLVRRLLAAKCNVNAATNYEVTPLLIACSTGNESITKQLLEAGADHEAQLPGGENAIMIASRTGNRPTIAHLIEHGAKSNSKDRKGQTALMWAAAMGNVDAVDLLLTSGADKDASTKPGFTAMMFAAREGHMAVAARLLEVGVDVNQPMAPARSGNRAPRKGTSALLMAVESGHFELAMFFVANGADPNDQRSGFSPLHVLSWVCKPDRGESPEGDPPPRGSGNLTAMQFVRAITAAGADVNLKLKSGKSGKAVLNRKGASPMLLAAKTANLELMKLLVELGADPLTPNADGCTPIMAAAGVGVRAVGEEAGTEPEVLESIEFLLAHGADVNTVDKNKETAMHGAAYRCFPKVIEYLASNGADSDKWNHKNRSGWTPVMIGKGHRPGSFKPSPPTVKALQLAMKKSAKSKN